MWTTLLFIEEVCREKRAWLDVCGTLTFQVDCILLTASMTAWFPSELLHQFRHITP